MSRMLTKEAGVTKRRVVWLRGLLLLGLVSIGSAIWLVKTCLDVLAKTVVAIVLESFEPLGGLGDFQMELIAGDTETAYTLTTKQFQKNRSLNEFTELVDAHEELRSAWPTIVGKGMTGDSCLYEITAETDDGRRSTFQVQLRADQGRWKVDNILFP